MVAVEEVLIKAEQEEEILDNQEMVLDVRVGMVEHNLLEELELHVQMVEAHTLVQRCKVLDQAMVAVEEVDIMEVVQVIVKEVGNTLLAEVDQDMLVV